MNCPTCNERMREVTKYNVQVDICPGCKGVWLDRGELEKIIQIVSGEPQTRRPEQDRERDFENRDHDGVERKYHDKDHDDHHGQSYGQGRRKGWLSDLFD